MNDVMARIAKLPLTGNLNKDELGLSELGLTPEQITVLFGSVFYKGFEDARYRAFFESAKAGKMTVDERLSLIEQLLSSKPTDEERNLLEFAKTVLTTLDAAQMKYLLETKNAFQLLDSWFPSHEMAVLRNLLWTKGSSGKVVASDFVKAILLVAPHKSVDESIAHPVVKSMIQEYRKLQAVAVTPPASKFIAALFFDICGYKMGLQGKQKSADVAEAIAELETSLLASIIEIVDVKGLTRKAGQQLNGYQALEILCTKAMEIEEAEKAKASEKVEKRASDSTVIADSQDAAMAATVSGNGGDKTKEADEFKIGDILYVIKAVKEKEHYLNYKGEVVNTKERTFSKPVGTVTLKMLDGPKKGAPYIRPTDCVARHPPTVSAAGKRPASASCDGADSASAELAKDASNKKAKVEEEKMEIECVFGAPVPNMG